MKPETYIWMLQVLKMIVANEGQLSAEEWAEVLSVIEDAEATHSK